MAEGVSDVDSLALLFASAGRYTRKKSAEGVSSCGLSVACILKCPVTPEKPF